MRRVPHNHSLQRTSLAGVALEIKNLLLKEATKIEIISLVDNSIDFLSSTPRREVQPLRQWTRERFGEEWSQTHTVLPIAEHGFSMFVRVFGENSTCSILFDTGVSSDGVVMNAQRMGLDLSETDYVVLSHGHYDHFGGLQNAVKAIGKPELTIIAHEDMFKIRGTANSHGALRQHPQFPTPTQVHPAKIVNTKQPYLIANDFVCVTGEIPRESAFEKGFPQNKLLTGSTWQPDPCVLDDRALVVNLKNKGLVVISGCAHAGIINTVRYAQQITGTARIYAVLGGFHLAGKEYENRIQPTLEELKKIQSKRTFILNLSLSQMLDLSVFQMLENQV